MSDLIDTPLDSSQVATSMGRQLRNAREQSSLSIDDVCTQLRISPRQVKALENDDFAALPEATITRGFIRNYARLLGMDAQPLLEAYRASAPIETPRALSLQSENILISGKSGQPWLKYILLSLVVALLLGAWQFYMDMPKPVSEPADVVEETGVIPETQGGYPVVMEPLPMPALPGAETSDPAVPGEISTSDQVAESPAAAATGSEEAVLPATNTLSETEAVAPGLGTLKLSFTGRSWINVTDKDKKVLLDRIMPAGSEEIVEGRPPLSIVIGNATVSALMFNGKPVDLAPHTRADVARLVLE